MAKYGKKQKRVRQQLKTKYQKLKINKVKKERARIKKSNINFSSLPQNTKTVQNALDQVDRGHEFWGIYPKTLKQDVKNIISIMPSQAITEIYMQSGDYDYFYDDANPEKAKRFIAGIFEHQIDVFQRYADSYFSSGAGDRYSPISTYKKGGTYYINGVVADKKKYNEHIEKAKANGWADLTFNTEEHLGVKFFD